MQFYIQIPLQRVPLVTNMSFSIESSHMLSRSTAQVQAKGTSLTATSHTIRVAVACIKLAINSLDKFATYKKLLGKLQFVVDSIDFYSLGK